MMGGEVVSYELRPRKSSASLRQSRSRTLYNLRSRFSASHNSNSLNWSDAEASKEYEIEVDYISEDAEGEEDMIKEELDSQTSEPQWNLESRSNSSTHEEKAQELPYDDSLVKSEDLYILNQTQTDSDKILNSTWNHKFGMPSVILEDLFQTLTPKYKSQIRQKTVFNIIENEELVVISFFIHLNSKLHMEKIEVLRNKKNETGIAIGEVFSREKCFNLLQDVTQMNENNHPKSISYSPPIYDSSHPTGEIQSQNKTIISNPEQEYSLNSYPCFHLIDHNYAQDILYKNKLSDHNYSLNILQNSNSCLNSIEVIKTKTNCTQNNSVTDLVVANDTSVQSKSSFIFDVHTLNKFKQIHKRSKGLCTSQLSVSSCGDEKVPHDVELSDFKRTKSNLLYVKSRFNSKENALAKRNINTLSLQKYNNYCNVDKSGDRFSNTENDSFSHIILSKRVTKCGILSNELLKSLRSHVGLPYSSLFLLSPYLELKLPYIVSIRRNLLTDKTNMENISKFIENIFINEKAKKIFNLHQKNIFKTIDVYYNKKYESINNICSFQKEEEEIGENKNKDSYSNYKTRKYDEVLTDCSAITYSKNERYPSCNIEIYSSKFISEIENQDLNEQDSNYVLRNKNNCKTQSNPTSKKILICEPNIRCNDSIKNKHVMEHSLSSLEINISPATTENLLFIGSKSKKISNSSIITLNSDGEEDISVTQQKKIKDKLISSSNSKVSPSMSKNKTKKHRSSIITLNSDGEEDNSLTLQKKIEDKLIKSSNSKVSLSMPEKIPKKIILAPVNQVCQTQIVLMNLHLQKKIH
ncbi:uncharacterized protein [Lepeophtheirus salmonis]|uniref:uncharacterized protein isoform X1 n=1 Tax=Lepeophtheirus salmonis TaxID=72036 RepID=UPI003AF38E6C